MSVDIHRSTRGPPSMAGLLCAATFLLASLVQCIDATTAPTPNSGDCEGGTSYRIFKESNYTISNSQFTASSSLETQMPWLAKYNHNASDQETWCPDVAVGTTPTEWLRVDFGQMMNVSAMLVGGRFANGQGTQYTPRLLLKYQRLEGGPFIEYEHPEEGKYIPANKNVNLKELIIFSPKNILATSLQFYPLSNGGTWWACLFVDVIACRLDGVASYVVPQGNTMTVDADEVKLIDYTYDGSDQAHTLIGGLGQLTNGVTATDSLLDSVSESGLEGYEWVGWNRTSHPDGVTLLFKFDVVRNFTQILLHTSNELSRNVQVFASARVSVSVGGVYYPDSQVVEYTHTPDLLQQKARPVNLLTGKGPRVGKFVKIELRHASEWILVSEVDFVSIITPNGTVMVEPDGTTPDTNPIIDPGNPGPGPVHPTDSAPAGSGGLDKNSIGVIVGVSVAAVLGAVVVVFIVCRRQRKAGRDDAASPTSSSSGSEGAPYKPPPHGYNGLPTSEKDTEAVYDEPWVNRGMGDGSRFPAHNGGTVGAHGYPAGTEGYHHHHHQNGYFSEGAHSQTALTSPVGPPHRPPQQGTMSSREYAVPELTPGHTMEYPTGHPRSAFQPPAHTMQHPSSVAYPPQVPATWTQPHPAAGVQALYPPPMMAAPQHGGGAPYHHGQPHPFQHSYPHQQQFPHQMAPPGGVDPMSGSFYPTAAMTGTMAPTISSIQGASGNSVYASSAELNGNGMVDGFGQPSPSNTPPADYPLMEIPKQHLKVVDKLGVGQFGEVNLCEAYNIGDLIAQEQDEVDAEGNCSNNNGGCRAPASEPVLVAVKVLKLSAGEHALRDFEREMRLMGRLRDPNVVRLLGVSTAEKPACMIVEYMPLGDLHEFLNRHRPAEGCMSGPGAEDPHGLQDQLTLSRGCLMYMARQIASGMKYLSGKHMVHRDLAARNCLVGPRYSIKVSDFGMSRSLYSSDYYRIEGKVVLPIRWMAWESILLGKFTAYSDVWSFGVTLWEILTFARRQPYSGMSDEEVIANCSHFYRNDGMQTYLERPGTGSTSMGDSDAMAAAAASATGSRSSPASGTVAMGAMSAVCPKEVYDLMKECWNHEDSARPPFSDIHLFLSRKTLGYNPEQEPTYRLYCGESRSDTPSDAGAGQPGRDDADEQANTSADGMGSGNASTAIVGSESPGSAFAAPADV